MEPFVGQIMAVGFNFAPRGWALCDGQLLPISQNSALFSLLGTIYGGDGRTTFALPDLRGRVSIHQGGGPGLSNRRIGQKGGEETHTLNVPEMPSHNHSTSNNNATDQHLLLSAETAVNEIPETGDIPAVGNYTSGIATNNVRSFGPPTTGKIVNGQTLSGNAGLNVLNNGGNQAHNNMQPYLTTNYIIALVGLFPSRS
ncbi:tail fiber protein [uncultured Aquimarina sp.]|uniref:phage tail protein n=1 Tax=uncultured Aquimarina sp. TaxID=575652 RepID=UPI002614B62F|nr:tail fiber protein [uncultured Aquimarina sp.]